MTAIAPRFRRLLIVVTERPRLTLALIGFLTASALAATLQLRLETDGRAFVPSSDPVVSDDRRERARFGLDDPLLIGLSSTAVGTVDAELLEHIETATDTVHDIPGIESASVASLATVLRCQRNAGEIVIRPLLQPLPMTPEARGEISRYILDSTPYPGLLVARDASAALVSASLKPNADRARVYEEVRRRLTAAGIGPIHLAGPVVAESQLGIYILRDLTTMLPLVSIVVGIVLFLTYRSWWAVVLPIVEVGIVIVWTFGLMAICGSPIYVPTAILPVILMAIGVADEIHIFGHYREEALLHLEKDRRALVIDAVEGVRLPVIFAAITTALGFLSFSGASMPPLQSFGLYTAFGVMAAMVLTLTYIPAALVLLPVPASPRRRTDLGAEGDLIHGGWLGRGLAALGSMVHDHRGAVLALSLVLALVCTAGIRRVYVEDSWFANFGKDSEVRRAGDFLDEKFSGSHELDVVIDSGSQGGALAPEFLARLDAVTKGIAEQPDVGAALSVLRLLQFLHKDLMGGGTEWIPESAAQATQLTELARLGGAVDIDHLVDIERRSAVIRVFVRKASYAKVDKLVQSVRQLTAQHFGKPGEQVSLVGDVMVSQTTVGLIVGDQIRSLVLALGLVLVTASVMFRSLIGGLFAVLPLCLAVLLNFAVMGFADIPLGIATSMFASLAIGIGVDYAIHFLARYAQALKESEPRAAIRLTLATTGKAIFWNAAVVALGFSVLGASAMPPNRMLGLLVALSMMTSFGATVTLLPAALAVVRPAFLTRMR